MNPAVIEIFKEKIQGLTENPENPNSQFRLASIRDHLNLAELKLSSKPDQSKTTSDLLTRFAKLFEDLKAPTSSMNIGELRELLKQRLEVLSILEQLN